MPKILTRRQYNKLLERVCTLAIKCDNLRWEKESIVRANRRLIQKDTDRFMDRFHYPTRSHDEIVRSLQDRGRRMS